MQVDACQSNASSDGAWQDLSPSEQERLEPLPDGQKVMDLLQKHRSAGTWHVASTTAILLARLLLSSGSYTYRTISGKSRRGKSLCVLRNSICIQQPTLLGSCRQRNYGLAAELQAIWGLVP